MDLLKSFSALARGYCIAPSTISPTNVILGWSRASPYTTGYYIWMLTRPLRRTSVYALTLSNRGRELTPTWFPLKQ